ncbi:unnamed protein product [Schistosoma margrebowiei]|uniref:Uncharacterized protein n=1 Tax=Schistosoma margrebowiei TaxID=48269 RepID=A0A183N2V7_9TREM|nr:unnamed protein product [Schistosoma margrebowiei]
MGSSILREQMAYEPIVGHRLPWGCISSRCSTALWIRPLGQRLGSTGNPGFVLLGARQQGVPVILRELVLPDGFGIHNVSLYKNFIKRIIKKAKKNKRRTQKID